MKALTGIRHSRTLRNVKTGTNSIKECWPCPQQSVGRFIAKSVLKAAGKPWDQQEPSSLRSAQSSNNGLIRIASLRPRGSKGHSI
jgi:hypothetical protein